MNLYNATCSGVITDAIQVEVEAPLYGHHPRPQQLPEAAAATEEETQEEVEEGDLCFVFLFTLEEMLKSNGIGSVCKCGTSSCSTLKCVIGLQQEFNRDLTISNNTCLDLNVGKLITNLLTLMSGY